MGRRKRENDGALTKRKRQGIADARAYLADACNFECGLDEASYESIARCRIRHGSYALAFAAAQIALEQQPLTLRGLHYQLVSAGVYANTPEDYQALSRLMVKLRESGVVPFPWLVDNTRQTIKATSWAGIEDACETFAAAYRRDFWASLPEYVCIIVEKDAMAGTLARVTQEYDVPLHVIRGFASLSFKHEIAELWARVQKPIHAYYFGDHDPSGHSVEADLREKLCQYSGRVPAWERVAVTAEQLREMGLLPLPAKTEDTRTTEFRARYGDACAELDAVRADVLRDMLRERILRHIPAGRWEALRRTEALEREAFTAVLEQARQIPRLDPVLEG